MASHRKRRRREPIGRAQLVKLTRDMGLDERVITDAQLDVWASKLKGEPTHYRQGRLLMEKFLPWLCDRLEESRARMAVQLSARHPSEN
jgi:hypothetical protein